MKKTNKASLFILLVVPAVFSSCSDMGESSDTSDPQDLIKTWIITEFKIDGSSRDFSDGDITFTGSTFYGTVNGLDGIGSCTFAGDYTADGKTLCLDVLETSNEEMFMPGIKTASYKADPSRARFSYTSWYGTHVNIKLEY